MKVYKVELMVVDYDEVGAVEITDILENTRYPNRCIGPEVITMDSRDIGEWDDDHPLNCDGRVKEFKRLFNEGNK